LSKGEDVRTKRVFSEEKTTKPPKRYTQGDLLKAMEGAGKQIDDEVLRQQLKGKGLGTVATRPAIMENLIDRGYILQDQRALKPTEKGSELIRLIKERLPHAQLLVSAEMTGQMEFNLSKVEKGELTIEQYMADVEEAIGLIIEELRSFEHKHGKTPLALAPSGKAQGSGKANRDSAQGKTVAKEKVAGTKTTNYKKLVEKTRETSDKVQDTASEEQVEVLGTCPKCGGEVIEGQKGFGCASWREGCHFVLWKTPICGKALTPNQIKSLLKKGKTPLIKGFKSKSGKSFSAYLIWEDPVEAKLKFEFEKE
jgi:DNA topoisomerase-3